MPVGVGVALAGAEVVDVHPHGAGLLSHRLRDPVDELLEVEVLLHREVAGHLLAVLLGGHQSVAVRPWDAVLYPMCTAEMVLQVEVALV